MPDIPQSAIRNPQLDYPLMTEDEQKVWQVLATCRGRAMAILGPEIEALTGIKYKQVQKIVSGLECHHGKFIGSGTCGYFIPMTREEYEASLRYLRRRAIVALHRASVRQGLSMEAVFGQAVMEFQGAA
jgi:hypothetical protein